LPE
jgi:hypothetical protein